MHPIKFHDFNTHSNLLKRKRLKNYLLHLFKKEYQIVEQVDIIFCSDHYLLELNKTFLSHNQLTDTLTFTIQSVPNIYEIYISIDRVKENSRIYKVLYQEELLRVIIHGCLHICGYNDKNKISAKKMISRQEIYLKKYLVSRETFK